MSLSSSLQLSSSLDKDNVAYAIILNYLQDYPIQVLEIIVVKCKELRKICLILKISLHAKS